VADGYTEVTEEMMSAEERFVLCSIKHLGKVTVQRTKEKGIFSYDYRCKIGDYMNHRYSDCALLVMQSARDAIYSLLIDDCVP